MTTLNLYLSELDQSSVHDTSGTFNNLTEAPLLEVKQGDLFYQAPLLDWQTIFKFYTDGDDGLTYSTPSFRIARAQNIIGTGESSSSVSNTVDLYEPSTDTVELYENNIIYDIGAIGGDKVGLAGNAFLSELAEKVFGDTGDTGLFANEDDLGTAFKRSIEDCALQVASEFSTLVAATSYDNLQLGTINMNVARKIWNQLWATVPERFELGYGASELSDSQGDDDVADATYNVSAADITTSGAGLLASVTVTVVAESVTSMSVETVGTYYAKNDTLTIPLVNGRSFTLVLNSVQAAILNGNLNNTSGIEFPLAADDTFHIAFTLDSPVNQTAGDGLSTIQAFSTIYDLNVKLGPVVVE